MRTILDKEKLERLKSWRNQKKPEINGKSWSKQQEHGGTSTGYHIKADKHEIYKWGKLEDATQVEAGPFQNQGWSFQEDEE